MMKKLVSVMFATCVALCAPAFAQESVCARVKIEIKQELTLERQAFDAEMKITNSLPLTPLTEIRVDVKVTDEQGVPVPVTTDPNDLSAKFFLRQTQRQGIDNTTGTGQVAAGATATVNWLLIPAPGSAGTSPFGKRYLIGATLRYRFNGETQVMELNPDLITVKPLPQLTLDYFLTRDIVADNPFTPQIEAPEPYTLGVRVKNAGLAPAKELKIESAQPRIVENQQGLPIEFKIIGSYVQDAPSNNSLLINFGNIPASSSKMGRWIMQTNLAGTFVDFTARYTHSDELGGALTSLLQGVNTHSLVRDVRVDLPGRDMVRDFLALDGSALNVYESNGEDNVVVDRSSEATLTGSNGNYLLNLPATQGFIYIRKPDPFSGTQVVGRVLRSDAKTLAPENVWLSKGKDTEGVMRYWVHIFDVNSPGTYAMTFQPPPPELQGPVMQFLPDRVTKEGQQLGFLVEASSPMGRPLTITATQLPSGATVQDQGDGVAVFDWTPAVGQAGEYIVNFTASDGKMSAMRSAKIRVETLAPPAGPTIPQIVAPLSGAEITQLRPQIRVLAGQASNEPATQIEFELYADVGMTSRIAQTIVPRNAAAGEATAWSLTQDLNDNTRYWWRARALAPAAGGGDPVASEWVDANFLVNLFNDPPENFTLTSPRSGVDVGSLTPWFAAAQATDADGDAITYGFQVYSDSALTTLVDSVSGLQPDPEMDLTVHWTATVPLTDRTTYYWRGIATDAHGAQTTTPARWFKVRMGNEAPTIPVIDSPAIGSDVTTAGNATLRVNNSTDADGDAVSYVFELDVVNTFDSETREMSPPIPGGSQGTTSWSVSDLQENQRYFWRAKAMDATSESGWVNGDFLMDATNEAPSVPTIANPGQNAWVSSVTPTFEVNPSTDPEGDVLSYEFQVYGNPSMATLVTSGTTSTTLWHPMTALQDKKTHYWRARTRDAEGAYSAWTALTTLYVSTGTYVAPSIAVQSPATIIDARSGSASITWSGTDPNIEPTIALYYDTTGSGFTGTQIVDGLKQNAGTSNGSYTWNMSQLPAGAYSIYGVIYDDKGLGRSYAPGKLVIPASPQLGALGGFGEDLPGLREYSNPAYGGNESCEGECPSGGDIETTVTVTLNRAPVADVVISITSSDTTEAVVSKQQLVFTPANWSTPQTFKVMSVIDDIVDGDQPFTITLGNAVSADPHFIGIGAAIHGSTADNGQGSSDM